MEEKDQDDYKSPAQLEQEARERIRAEIEKDVHGDKPTPGQPIVVKHNKKKRVSERSLSAFSACSY